MKRQIFCAILFLSTFHFQPLFAQNSIHQETDNVSVYHYIYTFEGATSEEMVNQTKEAISTLLNVSEVKVKFKSDSGKGEFLITVTEKMRSSESEEQFSPKMVKDVILQNGLQPLDFTLSTEK